MERAYSLVKPSGMVGLLTPSGIASDLSASAFFRKVATGGHLKSFYDFENRSGFFPDVHRQFKFTAMIGSPSRTFPAAECGFFLQAVGDIANAGQTFPITAADFAKVNPNTGTAPIFRNRRDMALTTAIYARCPVLVDRSGPDPVATWPVKYHRMFDMTLDSGLFRTRKELEERENAWPIACNRWQSAAGEWVPLYEGKMIWHFDHRRADVTINLENQYRVAGADELDIKAHQDPSRFPMPQFWVNAAKTGAPTGPTLAFRDVTNPTDRSTMVASIIPHGAAGNTLPLIIVDSHNPSDRALLAGNLCATMMDYLCRQKVQKNHLNWYIVEQLPVIPPPAYSRAFGPKLAGDIVREAVLELTYTAHDMAPFARDMRYVDAKGDVLPPFVWDEERRLNLRAKLDALYFILYGVFDPANAEQSRDDIRYIYSTFPIVEREETARWGRYRSRDLALSWVNALMAGKPDAKVAG